MSRVVALIGCGNIGNRWLQSMYDYLDSWNVYVVEANIKCLEERKLEHQSKRVVFLQSIHDLPKHLDLCAIATTSDVRRKVFDELISNSDTDNVIFEKVLFQREMDYYHTKKELEKRGIHAWVNHTRRETSGYKQLKRRIGTSSGINISIMGNEWGLCCNGLHMLDLISYFGECVDLSIDASGVLPIVVESKRPGFFELYGRISGDFNNNHYSICCNRGGTPRHLITICTDKGHYIIDEASCVIMCSEEVNDWKWEVNEFVFEYTSQIMGRIISDILENKKCFLTEYNESMHLHLQYIRKIISIFEANEMEVGICPIT